MYVTNDRADLILSLYDKLPQIKVITDLGCMDGATLDGISSTLGTEITYYGIDYTVPRKFINSHNFTFIKCDLNLGLHEIKDIVEETDLILILDVLEHLNDPEIFLEKLGKMMKTDAQIVITVPNASSVRKLIAWLKNDFPRNDIGYFDKTHRSWFTTKSIKKLIPPGINVDTVGYVYSKKTIFKIFQKILPSRLTSQFYIKLTKE